MTRNYYDQASRYVVKKDADGFLRWALRTSSLVFHRWLDTRRIPFPGEPDRTGDTVACLEDPAAPGELWAVAVEFQYAPKADLFGRLLNYLGSLWEQEQPPAGGRYHVGAVVIYLTGAGHTSRDMQLANTGIRTCVQAVERNMEREDAATVLAGIAAGTIARYLLPWVPLMKGGAEAGIIQQWLALASAEPDAKARGDYGGLALFLSEPARRKNVWEQALQGWNMIQSQQVLEWMAEGEAKGKVKGKAEAVLEVLEAKFGALPGDLAALIRATVDLAKLKQWLAAAATVPTLAAFRQNEHI